MESLPSEILKEPLLNPVIANDADNKQNTKLVLNETGLDDSFDSNSPRRLQSEDHTIQDKEGIVMRITKCLEMNFWIRLLVFLFSTSMTYIDSVSTLLSIREFYLSNQPEYGTMTLILFVLNVSIRMIYRLYNYKYSNKKKDVVDPEIQSIKIDQSGDNETAQEGEQTQKDSDQRINKTLKNCHDSILHNPCLKKIKENKILNVFIHPLFFFDFLSLQFYEIFPELLNQHEENQIYENTYDIRVLLIGSDSIPNSVISLYSQVSNDKVSLIIMISALSSLFSLARHMSNIVINPFLGLDKQRNNKRKGYKSQDIIEYFVELLDSYIELMARIGILVPFAYMEKPYGAWVFFGVIAIFYLGFVLGQRSNHDSQAIQGKSDKKKGPSKTRLFLTIFLQYLSGLFLVVIHSRASWFYHPLTNYDPYLDFNNKFNFRALSLIENQSSYWRIYQYITIIPPLVLCINSINEMPNLCQLIFIIGAGSLVYTILINHLFDYFKISKMKKELSKKLLQSYTKLEIIKFSDFLEKYPDLEGEERLIADLIKCTKSLLNDKIQPINYEDNRLIRFMFEKYNMPYMKNKYNQITEDLTYNLYLIVTMERNHNIYKPNNHSQITSEYITYKINQKGQTSLTNGLSMKFLEIHIPDYQIEPKILRSLETKPLESLAIVDHGGLDRTSLENLLPTDNNIQKLNLTIMNKPVERLIDMKLDQTKTKNIKELHLKIESFEEENKIVYDENSAKILKSYFAPQNLETVSLNMKILDQTCLELVKMLKLNPKLRVLHLKLDCCDSRGVYTTLLREFTFPEKLIEFEIDLKNVADPQPENEKNFSSDHMEKFIQNLVSHSRAFKKLTLFIPDYIENYTTVSEYQNATKRIKDPFLMSDMLQTLVGGKVDIRFRNLIFSQNTKVISMILNLNFIGHIPKFIFTAQTENSILWNGLNNTSNLKLLELLDNKMKNFWTDGKLDLLQKALEKNCEIVAIRLELKNSETISPKRFQDFMKFLFDLKELNKISLTFPPNQNADLVIQENLSQNLSKINTLYLNFSPSQFVSDLGLSKFAEFFKKRAETLRKIYLNFESCPFLTVEGMESLVRSLQVLTDARFICLDFSKIAINSDALAKIRSFLGPKMIFIHEANKEIGVLFSIDAKLKKYDFANLFNEKKNITSFEIMNYALRSSKLRDEKIIPLKSSYIDDRVKLLFEFLQENTNLVELYLDLSNYKYQMEETISLIASKISIFSNLVNLTLNLENTKISDQMLGDNYNSSTNLFQNQDQAKKKTTYAPKRPSSSQSYEYAFLIENLQKLKNIKNLNLNLSRNVGITDKSLSILAIGIENWANLRSLNLNISNLQIMKSNGVGEFFESVERGTVKNLQDLTINFSDSYIDSNIKSMLKNIRYFEKLSNLNLNLDRVKIKDEDFNILSESISALKNLTKLSLSLNDCLEISDKSFNFFTDNFNRLIHIDSLYLSFSNSSNITEDSFINLALIIKSPLSNLHLKFDGCNKITEKGLKIFGEKIKNITTLKNLSFHFDNCEKANDPAFLQLTEVLDKNNEMKQLCLNFDRNQISEFGISKFSQKLAKMIFLIDLNLDFSRTKLKSGSIKELSTAIKSMKALKFLTLKLNSWQLQDIEFENFAVNLKDLSSLSHITLGLSCFECNHSNYHLKTQSISDLITYRMNLEHLELDLSNCKKFDDKALSIISEGLSKQKNLSDLHLIFNKTTVSDKGLQELSKALEKLEHVRNFSLLLSGCNLVEEGFKSIVQKLQNFKLLRNLKIDLSNSQNISDLSLIEFSKTFEKLFTLQKFTINISNCKKLTYRALNDFSLNLKKLTFASYIKIDLEDSNITDYELSNISRSLLDNPSLGFLSINLKKSEHLMDDAILNMLDHLIKCKDLYLLELKFGLLMATDETLKKICTQLEKLEVLKHLDLKAEHSLCVSNQGINELARFLNNYVGKIVFELIVNVGNVTFEEAQKLGDSISDISSLSRLTIGFKKNIKISSKALILLLKEFKKLKNVSYLEIDMTGCLDIADTAFNELSDIFSSIGSLEHLNINLNGCSQISDVGITYISRGIEKQKTLKGLELDFDGAKVTDSGIKSISKSLDSVRMKTSLSILNINLSNTSVSEDRLKTLLTELEKYDRLQELNLKVKNMKLMPKGFIELPKVWDNTFGKKNSKNQYNLYY